MKKFNKIHLILGVIFGIAAVALYSYGDMVGGSMMAAAVIGLSVNYVMRKAMLKDELKKYSNCKLCKSSIYSAMLCKDKNIAEMASTMNFLYCGGINVR